MSNINERIDIGTIGSRNAKSILNRLQKYESKDLLLDFYMSDYYDLGDPSKLKEWYENNNKMLKSISNMMDDKKYNKIINFLMNNRSNSQGEVSIYDLMFPNRIPNDYSYNSRSRIEAICRKMYQYNNKVIPQFVTTSIKPLSGASTSINTVFLAQYIDSFSMIMKEDYGSPTSLMVECVIGYKINELRKLMPYFVYTYGISQLESIYNDNYLMYGMEYNKNATQLYVEYIGDSIALANFGDGIISVLSGNNIITIDKSSALELLLYQIFCAVYYAYSTLGFKHNDLHTHNVLIVDLKKLYSIPIKVPTSDPNKFIDKYIITDKLVVIIDYGLSSIRLLGGTRLISRNSIFNKYEDSGPENDILRLLTWTIYKYDSVEYSKIYRDMHKFLTILFTGESPNNPSNIIMKEYIDRVILGSNINYNAIYYPVYPGHQHYLHKALLDFTNNIGQYLHNNDMGFPNILESKNDNLFVPIIEDPSQLYWYLSELPPYELMFDYDSIDENIWFRTNKITPIYEKYGKDNIIHPKYNYQLTIKKSLMEYKAYFKNKGYTLNMNPI